MTYLCYQMFFKHLLQASSELCAVTVEVGFVLVPCFTVDMLAVHAYYDGIGLA